MKPFKLLACLVTLQFTSGLTLKAADMQDFREWTDNKGRQITARLIDTPDADSVRIERQDGHLFTIPVKTFSEVDQTYVKACYAGKNNKPAPRNNVGGKSEPRVAGALAEADAGTWSLLNTSGSQPASLYENTGLDTIIVGLNQRFTTKGVKTNRGVFLQIRTEPSDLASRVKVTGELPSMNTAAFLKQIAVINNLTVKTDSSGMIVLVDPTPPPEAKPGVGGLFGMAMDPP